MRGTLEQSSDNSYQVAKYKTPAKVFYVKIQMKQRFCRVCGREQVYGGVVLHNEGTTNSLITGWKFPFNEVTGKPHLCMIWNCPLAGRYFKSAKHSTSVYQIDEVNISENK